MMAVNHLAKSAFGGVTAQLEVFGRVGLAHAAAVSDMQRNGFLARPVTKKDIENKEVRSIMTDHTIYYITQATDSDCLLEKVSIYHGLPEALKNYSNHGCVEAYTGRQKVEL